MTENMAARGEGLAGLAKEWREMAAHEGSEEDLAYKLGMELAAEQHRRTRLTLEKCIAGLAALEAAAPAGTAPTIPMQHPVGEPFIMLGRATDLLDRAKEAMECDPQRDEVGSDCWIWCHQTDLWLKEAAALATPSPQAPHDWHGHTPDGLWHGCAEHPAATQEQPAGSAPSIASTSVTTPRKITWFCRICERDHTAYCPAVSEENFLHLCDHCGQSFQGNQHECPSPSAPPLEQFFRNRFNAEWTPELERELLEIIAARNSAGSPRKVGEDGALTEDEQAIVAMLERWRDKGTMLTNAELLVLKLARKR